jgi:hypothetical protein
MISGSKSQKDSLSKIRKKSKTMFLNFCLCINLVLDVYA